MRKTKQQLDKQNNNYQSTETCQRNHKLKTLF
jgi:hypothetical protein